MLKALLPILIIITCAGPSDYIRYMPGDLPIVISVPHGGDLKPYNIPNRFCEGCSYIADLKTGIIGEKISYYLEKDTGEKPYVILNDLHRSKMDANRYITEGADGNYEMEKAWRLFQKYIQFSLERSIEEHGYALFLDLHGQAHSHNKTEIGYDVSKNNLRAKNYQNSTLVNVLSGSGCSISDFIVGNESLGCLYESYGYPSVPSCKNKYPLSNEKYFDGGYNTETYTTLSRVIAIQIECSKGVRSSKAKVNKFSKATAEILQLYLKNLENCMNI